MHIYALLLCAHSLYIIFSIMEMSARDEARRGAEEFTYESAHRKHSLSAHIAYEYIGIGVMCIGYMCAFTFPPMFARCTRISNGARAPGKRIVVSCTRRMYVNMRQDHRVQNAKWRHTAGRCDCNFLETIFARSRCECVE